MQRQCKERNGTVRVENNERENKDKKRQQNPLKVIQICKIMSKSIRIKKEN